MAESQITPLMVYINQLAGVKIVNERDMAIAHFNAAKYSKEDTALKDRLNEIAASGAYEEVASVLLKDGITSCEEDWNILGMFNSYEVHLFIYNGERYCLLYTFEASKSYLQQQEWDGDWAFLKGYILRKLKPVGFVPEDWKLTNETIVEVIGFLRDMHAADSLERSKIVGLLDDLCYDDDRSATKIDHIISLIKELGY